VCVEALVEVRDKLVGDGNLVRLDSHPILGVPVINQDFDMPSSLFDGWSMSPGAGRRALLEVLLDGGLLAQIDAAGISADVGRCAAPAELLAERRHASLSMLRWVSA